MGLAASQARFLGITARKSNIEYEGQQVNQQRTALAEEVNSLYSKLLSLKVPVAPDTTAFYETDYTFEVSNTDGYDGTYLVKSYYKNDDGTYYLNTERTYNKNVAVGSIKPASAISSESGDTGTSYYYNDATGSHLLTPNAKNSEAMAKLINDTYGPGTVADDEKFYFYQDEESGITYYISTTQLNEAVTKGSQFSLYNSANKDVTEKIAIPSANIEFDANNRMKKIDDVIIGDEKITFNSDINTKRVYDEAGYEAALRDYTMSKNEYDKEVADLNSQTESLHQEDKVLELRLNQIDTEQNELQTELEAVKSVLDKNIENTFKTFS